VSCVASLLSESSLAIRNLSALQDGQPTLSAKTRPSSFEAHPLFAPRAGRLRMTRELRHEPVMVKEVVELLAATPQGVVLDATLGGAGHSVALLQASNRHRVVGIDRDPSALEAAGAALAPFGGRARVVRARFDQLAEVLAKEAPAEPVAGVLFDLGVSSWQFDLPERGFSYRFEGPLDMRMDPDSPVSAREIVNEWSAEALAELFAHNGEGRFGRRIAAAIVAARPIETTAGLAEVVRDALPGAARRGGGHPAKRVFQAIRLVVNEEEAQLPPALEQAAAALVPGGRIVVISYHSGEDRTVKSFLAGAEAGWCTCPPGLPCVCGAEPLVRQAKRGAILPSKEEVTRNRRAASARLRAAERLAAPWRSPRSQGGRDGRP
jgi:16S rRNA (cytosine1402-N4)-methyltransferase